MKCRKRKSFDVHNDRLSISPICHTKPVDTNIHCKTILYASFVGDSSFVDEIESKFIGGIKRQFTSC